eukprot:CAMPEP_0197291298 /NCGR_PEP_ID=MMETSP0890-20130614/12807_1 /TAXON_ID=44058 ORGANISM="Aureoumbra lagunensis, Strain CCMP1510" /NCGR_SAMPLE_ID=MMETSP0890 /ASSEMBLY_ACC=CAM_ASM_000533 /LENGTH=35 /DNA_ID= /DNA_START= /DNA_END= /DNA_ORIENTATION=
MMKDEGHWDSNAGLFNEIKEKGYGSNEGKNNNNMY